MLPVYCVAHKWADVLHLCVCCITWFISVIAVSECIIFLLLLLSSLSFFFAFNTLIYVYFLYSIVYVLNFALLCFYCHLIFVMFALATVYSMCKYRGKLFNLLYHYTFFRLIQFNLNWTFYDLFTEQFLLLLSFSFHWNPWCLSIKWVCVRNK